MGNTGKPHPSLLLKFHPRARAKVIHDREIKRAQEEDRTEPDWSNTVEMIMRKGVKAYNAKAETPASPN
jgi:hypothetical protein